MILPPDEEKGEPKAEEKEEIKGKVLEAKDVVGKEPLGARKNSEVMGAELEKLAGQPEEEQAQEVVKSEPSPPTKLNEQLDKDNLRREQQKAEFKPLKISEIEVVNQDPMLKPYEQEIAKRMTLFKEWLQKFEKHEKGIIEFAGSYMHFGLNRVAGGIHYREWAPGAKKVCLCGEFNGWNRESHACKRDEFGMWDLFIPDLPDGTPAIKHGTKVKAALILATGQSVFDIFAKNIG